MVNSSRRADAENTPPAPAKSKVHGGIHGAARRRRARSAGGPHHPRYAVEHAKQRNAPRHPSPQTNARSSSPVDKSPYVEAMASLSLPRYLSRPLFRPIPKETVAFIAPELSNVELTYLRVSLQFVGPRMLGVLASVKADPPPTIDVLPKELNIVVDDVSCDMPTHMLGLYSLNVPAGTKRRVTLHPIHSIILSSHCANLPTLPASRPVCPEVPGSTITVPVVPLCIPAPDLFAQLSSFLYTKRIDHLLASLLPCPVPQSFWMGDLQHDARLRRPLVMFAKKLGDDHSLETLLSHAMNVNGMWRNACALGIDDGHLWRALDVAWEVILHAIAVGIRWPRGQH